MAAPTRRVLVVDDEPNIVKMVSVRLKDAGFDVLVAMDGEEALTVTRTEHPDLIVLDLIMPRRDGFEVLEALKKDPQTRDIPIIVFTGKGQEGYEARCQQLGAAAYANKLAGAKSLVELIQSILGEG